jgi:glycosyltransferase involved in cell wall biosynthesis
MYFVHRGEHSKMPQFSILDQQSGHLLKSGRPARNYLNTILPILSYDITWPKISIVTPSYNQGQFLETTIRSVLLQNYPNLEYIIIDGGSTDDSLDIIKRYEANLTYWVSEPDSGQTNALNKGFAHATGDFLCWINSDDYFLEGSFEAFAETAMKHPDTDWFIGRIEVVDECGNMLEKVAPRYNSAGDWYNFVATRQFDTELQQPATFFSRRAWMAVGELDESLKYVMDFDYWGRLAYSGYRPVTIDFDIAGFRVHQQSKTSEGLLPFWFEEIKVVDKWLKICTGTERKHLMQCKRFLLYGCIKLWLIRQLSKLFGYKKIDELVTRYCRFKKWLSNLICCKKCYGKRVL